MCARDVETWDLWACFTLSGPVPYLRFRGAGRGAANLGPPRAELILYIFRMRNPGFLRALEQEAILSLWLPSDDAAETTVAPDYFEALDTDYLRESAENRTTPASWKGFRWPIGQIGRRGPGMKPCNVDGDTHTLANLSATACQSPRFDPLARERRRLRELGAQHACQFGGSRRPG